jgi:hypothetical protein
MRIQAKTLTKLMDIARISGRDLTTTPAYELATGHWIALAEYRNCPWERLYWDLVSD